MRECPVCFTCYDDAVAQCPADGRSTFHSLPGDIALERKYVLERRLGEGGMGIVYKAHHKFLKTTRAIKIIKPELVGNDQSFATRFHQEAMAAAAIGHPNIIAVPDFGFLEEKIPFIVMEFVEGISLQDLMNNEGIFTPEKALDYLRIIASAVGAAHAHGIVHRDLKPLNIMLNRGHSLRDQIRILDFGLAKIKSPDLFGSFVGAKTTGIIGSPYYMAPEQWSDEETDKRVDIYSLGIILYQMLMGDVPFKGSGIPAIMKKHLMTPPPPLSIAGNGISVELEKVVHHALEKDPEMRTASAEDLIAELEQAVARASTAKAKTKTRARSKTKAAARAKANEAAQTGPDSLGATSTGSVSKEHSGGQISAQDLATIVPPIKPVERSGQQSSLPAPAPTQSQADLLREASEAARRKAEERAFREVEESGELPYVNSKSAPHRPQPVSLPGRALVGQHSVTGTLFRKRFVLPVAAVVLVLAAIILFPILYLQKEAAQPSVETVIPAKPSKAREMVLIEGGVFTMGSDSGDQQKGAHEVNVPSFYIDKFEITNADYAEFIKATKRPAPTLPASVTNVAWWIPWNGTDPPPGREKWPVCNVSARDAADFADWLSGRDGVKYRLPTEEEWEFAARNGSRSSRFPWGDSWIEGRANLNQKSSPANVGSFPDGATQQGVQDMIGNVWEWTSTKARYYTPDRVVENVTAHVRRGGSFFEGTNSKSFQDATSRGWFGDEHFKFPTIGFRLARDRE